MSCETASPSNDQEESVREHKAVQIIKPDAQSKGGFTANEHELERIFGHQDVANTPVAIYSLAGAYRTGKSFMLNLFLRYLRPEKQNKQTTESSEDELAEGFAWRGGKERHTAGIWIWDQPFFVNTRHGKVAMFLMDTQGAFDHRSSVKDCSVIFALSTLLSSVQIYNVQNKIQADTLQHLQLFTEYAKVAAEKHKTGKTFQKLVFLVRDWSDTDYSCDFNGGAKVWQELADNNSHNEETTSMLQGISHSFDKISCCLIKNPGGEVAERNADQGSRLLMESVRSEFLDTVEIVVQELFSSSRVVAKTINEKPVTGKDLINYTLAYKNVLGSGKMPAVKVILEATAKVAVLQIIQECKQSYRNRMTEICQEGCQNEGQFHEFHNQKKSNTLSKFDQQLKIGNREFMAKYRNHLDNIIDLEFVVFDQINKANKERLKNEALEAMVEAENIIKDWCDQHSGGAYLDEQQVCEIETKSREEAWKLYLDRTEEIPDNICEEYTTRLHRLIDEEFLRFKECNKLKREVNDKLQAMVTSGLKMYIEEITKATLHYREEGDLNKLHERLMNNAVEEGKSQITESNQDSKEQEELFQQFQILLEVDMENYFELVCSRNDEMEKRIIERALTVLQENKEKFAIDMNKLCDGKYMDESALVKEHKKMEKETLKVVSRVLKKGNCRMEAGFLQRTITELEELFANFKNQNVENRKIYFRKAGSEIGGGVGLVGGGVAGGFGGGFVGLKAGAAIGALFGPAGALIGGVVGGVSGALAGAVGGGVGGVKGGEWVGGEIGEACADW